jgi:hypothetical protein
MATKPSFHEDLRRDEVVAPPSEKSFGITFAVVALLLALWLWWRKDATGWALVALAASAAFVAAGFLAPALLAPLNRLWLRFGLLLHKIINPLVMGFLFFVVFTPMGVVMRLAGKDFLKLKMRGSEATYWVSRKSEGHAPSSMTNQF